MKENNVELILFFASELKNLSLELKTHKADLQESIKRGDLQDIEIDTEYYYTTLGKVEQTKKMAEKMGLDVTEVKRMALLKVWGADHE